ncbi:hypothetical protein RJ639_018068 [Escallonia herrerae]|uniref:Uncharacterized protein n=1 Tax=Escallonia herrerae TaxID=1293975 RepID=A0AA88VCZ2_9ASTE|nr:hypothetical protein RJ639_018068 [Escallonia herrerae]
MADRQQPWTLYVHAKAKKFEFKLKATRPFFPNCKLFRFSLLLKLCPFLIKVKSKPQTSISCKHKSFKSKFIGILEKLRTKRAKNKSISAGKSSFSRTLRWLAEGPICVSSVVAGNLALLYQSISEKDITGIIIYTSITVLYLVSLFKNFIRRRKACHLLMILSVAMVGCTAMVHMKIHTAYSFKGYITEDVWKACNYAASSGYLYVLAQVIYRSFRIYGRHERHDIVRVINRGVLH